MGVEVDWASLTNRPIESVATGTVVEMRILNFALLLPIVVFSLESAGSDNPPATNEDRPPATQEEREEAAFEYPFPDREDLFLPPAKKTLTRETQTEADEDVVLMGFADVGGARVVLKIDGIVTSLRVGESRGEVRVLAIDPPKVDLQRGERQWTESLADTP